MDIETKLESKLESIFPNLGIRAEAIEILNSYGSESHEQEPTRIRLAILKLIGQEPSIAKLKEFTNTAKSDYRDVLAWAEYPRQSEHWSATASEKSELAKADLDEYRTWLNT